jgi:hypothetical protein
MVDDFCFTDICTTLWRGPMTPKKPRKPELVTDERPKVSPRKRSAKASAAITALSISSESTNGAPTDDEIARKAYALWEDRGCPMGSPEDDWFRAKNELTMKAIA